MQHMHNTEQICNFLSGEEMAALLSRVVEGRQHGKATRVPRSFALLSFLESAKLALPAQRAVIAARFRERAIRPTMAIILTPQSGVFGVRQTTFVVRRWLIGTIPRMGLGGNSRAQRCRHARLADARLARDQDLRPARPASCDPSSRAISGSRPTKLAGPHGPLRADCSTAEQVVEPAGRDPCCSHSHPLPGVGPSAFRGMAISRNNLAGCACLQIW